MIRTTVFFLAVFGILMPTGAQIHWQDQSRMFCGTGTLSDVVWSGERYVAVGSVILTSTDGISWRLADAVSEKYLEWVVWTGNQFIAFGGGWRADFLTSPDGLTWTNHISVGRYLFHSVWTGKRFVATSDSGNIFTSEDLTKWRKQRSPVSSSLSNIIWTGTQLIAVGAQGTIITSEDGINWTKQVSNTTRSLYNAVWTGTQLVAVGDSGTVLISADGVNWTQHETPVTHSITNIVWTGTTLVATDKTSKALVSPDGIVWKEYDRYPRVQKIIHTKGRIYGIRIGYNHLYTSIDSTTWDTLSLPEGTADLHGLTYSNGRLIMVGDTLSVSGCDTSGQSTLYWKGGIQSLRQINHTKKGYAATGDKGIFLTSKDGFAWRRFSAGTPYRLNFVIATDSLYIVGRSGNILTSPDCITWTEKEMNATSLNDAASNDSIIVVVGYYGRIYTTRDGVNWTGRNSKTIDELNSIIWTGDRFIVGTGSTSTYGASDCILTSPDGITWTNHTRKPQGTILDIASSGSTLVAVGYGDRILSTNDLQEWTYQDWTRYNLQDLNAVVWTGSQFIAGGSSDSVYISADGKNWTPQHARNSLLVKSLLWSDSLLFAAGGYDDSAMLMIGSFVESSISSTQNRYIKHAKTNHPILYTGKYPLRIAEKGWMYSLDGRRVIQIPEGGKDSRKYPLRKLATGRWVVRGR